VSCNGTIVPVTRASAVEARNNARAGVVVVGADDVSSYAESCGGGGDHKGHGDGGEELHFREKITRYFDRSIGNAFDG
jgi:hypothetical protein